jgi:hypothetical protein
MRYRPFGKTGFQISALGFGAMRLPMKEDNGVKRVIEDEALAVIRRAFELGVNYIDSGYTYCASQSEIVVGKALKGWRDKVRISTKLPVWRAKARGDGRRFLDEQLRKLDVQYIDFYHLHGLQMDRFEKIVRPCGLLEDCRRARDEGLIRHISFSFHDTVENLIKFADMGEFDSVLCQYNLADRRNAAGMAHARKKGLGVAVMGPVGGGRLGASRGVIQQFAKSLSQRPTPEIALRFVLSNPDVDCALSGMGNVQMVEENAVTASLEQPLSPQQQEEVARAAEECKKLLQLYCTGCKYCLPCPQGVAIPKILEALIDHRVWNATERAKHMYNFIGTKKRDEKKADACVECGECEEKCPQKIQIRERLKEAAKELA